MLKENINGGGQPVGYEELLDHAPDEQLEAGISRFPSLDPHRILLAEVESGLVFKIGPGDQVRKESD